MPFWDKLESDWNFTGEDYGGGIGSDKSHRYMKYKRAQLYISTDYSSQRVVAFKPFLENFKLDFKLNNNEQENLYSGRRFKTPINVGITYSFDLIIPAASVNEARMNKRKLELLTKFLENYSGDGEAQKILKPKRHLVYLSNLIHNGNRSTTEYFDIGKADAVSPLEGDVYETFMNHACGGYITDINYTIVTEDGFFEYEHYLFPKTYKTSITFVAFNDQRTDITNPTDPKHYLTDSYKDFYGAQNTKVIKQWPFGITVVDDQTKKEIEIDEFSSKFLADKGYGYDHHYTDFKHSYIWFFVYGTKAGDPDWDLSKVPQSEIAPRAIAFKPYANEIKFSRKTTKNETFSSYNLSDFYAYPAEDATHNLSFDVLANNVNESIAMHAKIQELMRMISPVVEGKVSDNALSFPEATLVRKNSVLFSNLIYNKYIFKDHSSVEINHASLTSLKDTLEMPYNQANFHEFLLAGLPCTISSISYSPFLDMGFFEYEKMLWAKGFKLSFELSENYSTVERAEVYKLLKGENLSGG